MRAIRGAITADRNDRDAILSATGELLATLIESNQLDMDSVVSAIFTMTDDLDAVFPAVAARQHGWSEIPLLCARELDIKGSLPRCIRVMVHADVDTPRDRIKHVYLRDAVQLRPDLASAQ